VNLIEIVDAQLHDPGAWLEWDNADQETRRGILTELVLAITEAVGVDAVLLFPSAEEESWAEQLSTKWPGQFAFVPRANPGIAHQENALDPEAANVEERIAAARLRPGVKGMRFVASKSFWPEGVESLTAGRWDRALAACEREGLPIFMFASGNLEVVAPVAKAHPDLTIIVDHIGMKQPPLENLDNPLWKALPDLLELARYPNIGIKMCGAPSLSTEPYPFLDAKEPVRRIIDTFGPERLMWASDIGRFRGRVGWHMRIPEGQGDYAGKHTYAEALAFYTEADWLSETEKELILGGTVRRLLDWPANGLSTKTHSRQDGDGNR
jgi:L-fuconolactonase